MLKVLLADDAEVFLIRLRRMRVWKRFNIEIAGMVPDGKAALEQLRSQKIDILITDIKMPIMDGLELLRICLKYWNDILIR